MSPEECSAPRMRLRGEPGYLPTCVRSRLRLKNKGIPAYALLAALMWTPVLAVDQVPETYGFSGYILTGHAVFSVASNLIVQGAPLLSEIGNNNTSSIFLVVQQIAELRSQQRLVGISSINMALSSFRRGQFNSHNDASEGSPGCSGPK